MPARPIEPVTKLDLVKIRREDPRGQGIAYHTSLPSRVSRISKKSHLGGKNTPRTRDRVR